MRDGAVDEGEPVVEMLRGLDGVGGVDVGVGMWDGGGGGEGGRREGTGGGGDGG